MRRCLHGGVVVGRNGIGYQFVALSERLFIHLFVHAAVWNLEDIIDMQSPSTHADVVHHHKLQFPDASPCLVEEFGIDVVEVSLAEARPTLYRLRVASAFEQHRRHEHGEVFRLHRLQHLPRHLRLQCLAVSLRAPFQFRVVPHRVVDLHYGHPVVTHISLAARINRK